ncbi:hypothetical protein JG688_00016292 [Phytophthora aleatoria]|uniref:PiggyBac transposable element-derived protein 4 C-terminal zinc-ribbon domain-containing protein n=1 Tax=Phytophthora aleatoria TaxID=2496075 RepID=A0A8J5MCJ2_9STRA|nr:hypothetical protein JG688_00016292 [Phytophthora aleatoria]
MVVAKSNPGLVTLMWADNTIVYFLASQVSAEATTVRRCERRGGASDGEHKLTQSTDYRLNNGIQRLRPRQCKVCSFYKPEGKKLGGTSSYYCAPCSEGKKGSDLVQQGTWPSTERRPNLHSNLAPGVAKRRVHAQDKPHPRSWSCERVVYMQ